MRYCDGQHIVSANPNPRRPGTCVCGFPLDPAWTADDANLAAFFDRLAEGMFPYGPEGTPLTSNTFDSFRAHCERREGAGRERFGLRYLNRDNLAEGHEEAADLALYAWLDTLQAVRDGRGDEDIDLALLAAKKAFEAHEALSALHHRRNHAP